MRLNIIDQAARRLGALDGWKLRQELTSLDPAEYTEDRLRRQANARVSELKEKKPPTPGITYRRLGDNLESVTITDTAARVESIKAAVGEEDPLNTLHSLLFSDDAAAAPLKYTPLVVIPVDMALAAHSTAHSDGPATSESTYEDTFGAGDEVYFRTNNGAVIAGRELAQHVADELGYMVLVDTLGQPLNAYRARHGHHAHRVMATAETQTCAWVDCTTPASECQLHHIDAYKNGGVTSPDNLTWLCGYHNGVNDDDPPYLGDDPPPSGRGRVRRGPAGLEWLSPFGRRVRTTAPPPPIPDRLHDIYDAL